MKPYEMLAGMNSGVGTLTPEATRAARDGAPQKSADGGVSQGRKPYEIMPPWSVATATSGVPAARMPKGFDGGWVQSGGMPGSLAGVSGVVPFRQPKAYEILPPGFDVTAGKIGGCGCGGACGLLRNSSPTTEAISTSLAVGVGMSEPNFNDFVLHGGGTPHPPRPYIPIRLDRPSCGSFWFHCGEAQQYIRYLDARHNNINTSLGCAYNRSRTCEMGRFDYISQCYALENIVRRKLEIINGINMRRSMADQSTDLSQFDREIDALHLEDDIRDLTQCNIDASNAARDHTNVPTTLLLRECEARIAQFEFGRALAALENQDYANRRSAAVAGRDRPRSSCLI